MSSNAELIETQGRPFPDGCFIDSFKNILFGFEAFQRQPYDFCFFELDLLKSSEFPGARSNEEVLGAFLRLHPSTNIIVLSHQDQVKTAVDLVRGGAKAYLTYPVDPSELGLLVEKLGTSESRMAELNYLRKEIWTAETKSLNESRNKTMSEVFQRVSEVAKTKSTVLITGETGVGKGVLARLIHEQSTRSKAQFIQIHCGAIAENLIESELFGHEKGAFTGAINRKLGKFELANKGTVFLDEVSTLTPSAQIKLLQVLQDSKFQRVGGEADVHIDIRIIAATNEDLKELCEQGKFRKDLYYRLNVFPLFIPSLKERTEDLPVLIDGFLNKLNSTHQKNIKGIQPEALKGLMSYEWPGNIRELENLVERAYIIEKTSLLTTESFPFEIFDQSETAAVLPLNSELPLPEARSRMIENFERQYLKELLARTHGKVSQAAELSGVGVRQFNKLMSKYGLRKEDFKPTSKPKTKRESSRL